MSSALKLKLMVALVASLASTAVFADDKTLVVWDFKSSEPLMKPYFDIIKSTFEQAHPGVTVQEIAQPADTYYTIAFSLVNATSSTTYGLTATPKSGTAQFGDRCGVLTAVGNAKPTWANSDCN